MQPFISSIILIFSFLTFIFVVDKLKHKTDYVIYKNAFNVLLNAFSILLIIGFNINLYI
jgi:hypothetical protein